MDAYGFWNLLSTGGDLATFAIVWALWRMDRRLLTLETKIADWEARNNV